MYWPILEEYRSDESVHSQDVLDCMAWALVVLWLPIYETVEQMGMVCGGLCSHKMAKEA